MIGGLKLNRKEYLAACKLIVGLEGVLKATFL